MVQATQVPTSGFAVTPQVQVAPAVVPNVPPAPGAITSGGAGTSPVPFVGHNPGWVDPAVQAQQVQQPGQPPAQQPQGQPPAPQPDLTNIVGMLQAALAGQNQPVAQTPAAPEAAKVPGKGLNTFDVSSIGDPIIQSMATILQTAGKDLDLDRVLGKALQFGDPNLVDVAYLREAGGANAQQFTEIAQGIVKAVQAKADAVQQSVYESVGGEAVWHASVAAFNSTAPQELRVTVAQMLDSTNEQFIKAGAKIIAQFGAQSGAIPNHAGLMQSTAAAGAGVGQGLTKDQFQQELRKLDPNASGYEDARNNLFARRSLGKRAGM